jgi:hypothetical protein
MPRFSDQWLIDKTLFDYVQGGSCACCSFNFLPNGTKGLIESIGSEMETDALRQEVNSLNVLPWPHDMKEQVWMDRVRIRQYCKQQMRDYQEFWRMHGTDFSQWFLHSVSTEQLQRLFQLPRSDIVDRLLQKGHGRPSSFSVHAAFGSVLCAATEQVAHFELTQYPCDGRGEAEVGFESCLVFDRRGGFTLNGLDTETTKRMWLLRHETLGGPTLLERNAKKVPVDKRRSKDREDNDDDGYGDNDDDADIDDNDDADDNVNNNNTKNTYSPPPPTPSFRSDRRIVRLLIARQFADVLQRAYMKEHHHGEETCAAGVEVPTTTIEWTEDG